VQEEACVNAIKNDGFTPLKIIRDEGKSGGTLKRSGIEEIIGLAINKKIQAVYTISSDRLNRNTMDYLYLRDLFRKNGVELRYVYQPTTDDSAMSRTMDTVMASFNEMQRLVISEKVRKTLNAKAEAGYFPSVAPLGYKNIKNPDNTTSRLANKIIVPNTEMAPLIKEAFKLYITGNYNGYDLNDIMYKKGLRTKKGEKLAPSRFYEMFKNRLYIGELHWGDIHIGKAQHEPIIEKETFDYAQSIMAGHNYHASRRRKYSWLLSGFLYCAEHGKRYAAEWHLDKKLAYYHCTNRHGCGKYIEKTQMENMVAEKFKDIQFDENFIELVINKAKEIFYNRREQYDAKRQNLINKKTALELKRKNAEDKLLNGILPDEDFTKIRGQINLEINEIEEKLFDLENKQDVKIDVAQEILRFTENIYRTYTKAPDFLKRHYLSLFWDRFEVADGLIIKSVPSLLFRELLTLQQVFLKTENNEKTREIMANPNFIIKSPLLPN